MYTNENELIKISGCIGETRFHVPYTVAVWLIIGPIVWETDVFGQWTCPSRYIDVLTRTTHIGQMVGG